MRWDRAVDVVMGIIGFICALTLLGMVIMMCVLAWGEVFS